MRRPFSAQPFATTAAATIATLTTLIASQAMAESDDAEKSKSKSLHSPNETLSRIFFEGDWSMVGTLDMQLTSLANASTTLYGAKAMLMNSNHNELGLGVRLSPTPESSKRLGQKAELSFVSGGVYFGSEENDRELFQFWSGILLGVADINATNTRHGDVSSLNFITEPEIGFAIKITDNIRLGSGLSWRGVWGDSLKGLTSRSLDAWSANITLRVGDYLRTCNKCGIIEN